jgi:hypothetical protein
MPDLAKALEHLEKIAAGKLSFGELVTVGEDPAAPLAVALAAWRRLEAASGAKPADADQLYHERAVQVTLRSMIRIRIADPDRRTALLNELASSGQAGPAAAQRASGAGEPGPVKTESGQAEPAAKTVPVATVENSPGQ